MAIPLLCWNTNKTSRAGGPTKVNVLFSALRLYEPSFASDLPQQIENFKLFVTTFGRLETLMVNISREFQFLLTKSRSLHFLLFYSLPASQQPASQQPASQTANQSASQLDLVRIFNQIIPTCSFPAIRGA